MSRTALPSGFAAWLHLETSSIDVADLGAPPLLSPFTVKGRRPGKGEKLRTAHVSAHSDLTVSTGPGGGAGGRTWSLWHTVGKMPLTPGEGLQSLAVGCSVYHLVADMTAY